MAIWCRDFSEDQPVLGSLLPDPAFYTNTHHFPSLISRIFSAKDMQKFSKKMEFISHELVFSCRFFDMPSIGPM
jgi:hypothetical protein